MTDAIRSHVDRVATAASLDVRLVRALVQQESSGNPFAFRPEPRFRYFVDCRTGRPFRDLSPDELASKVAPPDFPRLAGSREQEWWLQQASLGLCQVMGAVAREQGLDAPFLSVLFDAETNLSIGCRVLAGHLAWARGDVALGLGAYNAGRGGARTHGADYSRKVLARMA